MGKLFEIRFFLIAAVVFIMAANGFSGNDNRPALHNQPKSPAATEHRLSVDFPFLSEFALHEGIYTVISVAPVSSLLKQWHSYKAVIHASEIQVSQTLAQIVSEILNFPVRIRKSDLLFPFHYFS